MKTSLILVLGCACANFSLAHAQTAAPVTVAPDAATPAVAAIAAPMTAAQILEKSRQTYAAFTTYKGSCSVVSDAVFAQGDAAPTQNVSSASAFIEFERGARLSVTGVDMTGKPFRAQWTPSETWLEHIRDTSDGVPAKPLRTEFKDRRIGPNDASVYRAVDGMMAGLSGFTGGTGSAIPNALMPDRFDLANPFSSLGSAKLLPARNLGNVPCYVIEQTVPELNSVATYWIEQKTFLLRRKTEEQGEQRYDDSPVVNGKALPIMRVAYSLKQYIFATTEAK